MAKNLEVTEQGSFSAKDYHDPPPAPLIDPDELTKWSFYRALIAEFIATLLFLYITVLTVIGYKSQTDPAKNADQCGGVGILGIAWAFGGMIFVLVYLHCRYFWGSHKPSSDVRAVPGSQGVAGPSRDVHGGSVLGCHMCTGVGLAAEIIGTFVLVYTVFSATDPKRSARDSHVPVLAPLPIGFAVFMVHLATIPITGTGINPARSFGAAVIYNQDKAWDDQWMFWVGPFIGAAIAAFYHQFILRAGAVKALGSFRSNPHV
ncbi:hypothetical protein F0562_031883 [Nyssa sinensis]|uniref:Aquaporin n=1 Tax=Nyssa sinensis TaxID=561372 RepID=A0A5J5AX25_9ASTE|nr:hypothetical protein F0562_031883 [Nyssa sinensis]